MLLESPTNFKKIINNRLSELVALKPEPLFAAARYSLLSAGKRLRPLLVFATVSSFGKDPRAALDPACAIEMIHTYSLIHDDLPCMDDDDLRRGVPTLHKAFNEPIALLTGDYLLTFAFEVLAGAEGISAEQKIQLIKILSERAGSSGMIGGQAIDIESQGKKITEETLFRMHKGKTASLISACLEFGAAIAQIPFSTDLQSIGEILGLAYQIQDDLFDTADADGIKQKPNAVSLWGVKETELRLEKMKASLFEKLSCLPLVTKELESLIQKILQRNS